MRHRLAAAALAVIAASSHAHAQALLAPKIVSACATDAQGAAGGYGRVTMTADGTLCTSVGVAVGTASFTTAQVSVGTAATAVAAQRIGRAAITIVNVGTTALYLGGSGVTTSNGLFLPGVVGASVTIQTSAAVYGVVATGTQTVSVLETYN